MLFRSRGLWDLGAPGEGTDAADATWDPIRGKGDVDTGVYVDDASVRLDSTAPPRGGDEDATTLRATPTPREEDFQGKSKKKVVEAFAKAEHKSAEAWRQEAMKAQRKLEELSAKGMEDDADLKKTASSVSKLKGLVREFKKALVFMTYLNDVSDGGTRFLNQDIITPAIKGLTLIWPTDWTHTHCGQISQNNIKYIATGWFSYKRGPKDFSIHFNKA